jgi:replication-associated recombination protein RarA
MTTDMEILQRAWGRERDPRTHERVARMGWASAQVGATSSDIRRLLTEELVEKKLQLERLNTYLLTEKGRGVVSIAAMEHERARIPAAVVLDALQEVVGFNDLKQALAVAVEARHRTHFILEGPPASGKSALLEGVRAAVPDAYMAFGSRTSAAGLADVLFEHQPSVLLLDELDKMRQDSYAVLLGLMESGEVLETKAKKTRGVVLNTLVLAACNSSGKMPPELLSRFALHAHFPHYTREEFLQVVEGFLPRSEGCPPDLARAIGEGVWDSGLGDVRQARATWQLMTAPTVEEAQRVLHLKLKYSGNRRHAKTPQDTRLQGM